MPDVGNAGFVTRDPGVYNYIPFGTAVGTVIVTGPVFLKHIFFPNRVASGNVIIYNSAGTSTNIVGTIVLGTQTFGDPPQPYELNYRLNNGLGLVNTGNLGGIVAIGI